MLTKEKTEEVIGLWYDTDSEMNQYNPAWIVSKDEMNEKGEAHGTRTLEWRNINDYDDAYDQAKEVAIETARKKNLSVIETDEEGKQSVVYSPKEINIKEGINHVNITLHLAGDRLYDPHWLHGDNDSIDLLKRNGLEVNDEMEDAEIENRVYFHWISKGYDGDPEENGLSVTVFSRKTIID